MKTFIQAISLLGFCLVLAGEAEGQTHVIVNTERREPADTIGFHFGFDGNASLTRGNLDLVDVDGTAILGYRKPKHWVRFLGGGDYLSQSKVVSLNSKYGQLRYQYFFNDRWSTYHFLQAQDNFSLVLRERVVIGSGLRRSFPLGDTSTFDLGVGGMWEREVLDESRLEEGEQVTAEVWRITSVLVWRQHLGKGFTLVNTAYVQPLFTDLQDIRVLDELSFLTRITEKLQMNISAYWRFDNRPPSILGAHDFGSDIGVVLSY